MTSFLMAAYSVAAYASFFVTFLYTVAFVGDLPVPRSIDAGPAVPTLQAVVVDLLLLAVFAVQHSVMARQSFKRWWTRIVPEPIERSTYVLAATLALALLLWRWRPIADPVVWQVGAGAVRIAIVAVFWAGWIIVLASTFLLDHLELFGLRQSFDRLRHRGQSAPRFRTPLFYRHVRHPLYLGFLLAFWAAPTMTAGHLLFAIGMTLYIGVGIFFEERDLVDQFGDTYRRYRAQVGMLLPWRKAVR